MSLVLLPFLGLRVHHRHHSQLHLGAARAVIPLLCLHKARLLVIIASGMSSTFTHTPEIRTFLFLLPSRSSTLPQLKTNCKNPAEFMFACRQRYDPPFLISGSQPP